MIRPQVRQKVSTGRPGFALVFVLILIGVIGVLWQVIWSQLQGEVRRTSSQYLKLQAREAAVSSLDLARAEAWKKMNPGNSSLTLLYGPETFPLKGTLEIRVEVTARTDGTRRLFEAQAKIVRPREKGALLETVVTSRARALCLAGRDGPGRTIWRLAE